MAKRKICQAMAGVDVEALQQRMADVTKCYTDLERLKKLQAAVMERRKSLSENRQKAVHCHGLPVPTAHACRRASHDSNMELIAQGIANFVSPIFGGIPATGAIARTMTNINNGGKSPVADSLMR